MDTFHAKGSETESSREKEKAKAAIKKKTYLTKKARVKSGKLAWQVLLVHII